MAAGVVCAVGLAALFVAPTLIDWNDYRGAIAAELSQATGRRVVLDGPIEASFLPSPRILANNVRLSGPTTGKSGIDQQAGDKQGDDDGDLLRLRSVELRVGLLPLLIGNIVIQQLTLVRPEILVETDDSGEARWVMDGAGGDLLPQVALQHFAISDGTLVWRDRDRGVKARIEKIALKLTADSLSGPAKAEGSAQIGGVPVKFTANIGHIRKGAPVPLNVTLAASGLDAKGEFSGQFVSQSSKLTGRAKASGSDARAVLGALFGAPAAEGVGPALIAHPFAVNFSLSAAGDLVEARDIALDLGDQHATGTLRVRNKDGTAPLVIEANLTAPKIDLDQLATVPALPAKAGDSGGLPRDMRLAFDFNSDAMLVAGKLVQGFVVKAALDDGKLSFDRLEGQLPGAGSFAVTGAVTGALAGDDRLAFDGSLDIKTANLRDVLSWLNVDTTSVPGDRLASAALKAKLSVDADSIQLSDLDLHVDATRAHGSARFDYEGSGEKVGPAIHLDLAADNLDLDAYRNDEDEPPAATPAAAASSLATPSPVPGLFGALSGDGRFAIGRLTYRSMDIRGVDFTASLANGEFALVNFSGVPPDPGEFHQPPAEAVEQALVPPPAAPVKTVVGTPVAGKPVSAADDRNDFVRSLLESLGASSSDR